MMVRLRWLYVVTRMEFEHQLWLLCKDIRDRYWEVRP